jgi:hypothetical protein
MQVPSQLRAVGKCEIRVELQTICGGDLFGHSQPVLWCSMFSPRLLRHLWQNWKIKAFRCE